MFIAIFHDMLSLIITQILQGFQIYELVSFLPLHINVYLEDKNNMQKAFDMIN